MIYKIHVQWYYPSALWGARFSFDLMKNMINSTDIKVCGESQWRTLPDRYTLFPYIQPACNTTTTATIWSGSCWKIECVRLNSTLNFSRNQKQNPKKNYLKAEQNKSALYAFISETDLFFRLFLYRKQDVNNHPSIVMALSHAVSCEYLSDNLFDYCFFGE